MFVAVGDGRYISTRCRSHSLLFHSHLVLRPSSNPLALSLTALSHLHAWLASPPATFFPPTSSPPPLPPRTSSRTRLTASPRKSPKSPRHHSSSSEASPGPSSSGRRPLSGAESMPASPLTSPLLSPRVQTNPGFLSLRKPSRRGSNASEKKGGRSKSRARSKSPFRSFRWPKKSKPDAATGGAYSDDEDNIRDLERSDASELESMLVRKHEWESTTKKTSNRSWDRVCVVLRQGQIGFYKDQKSYRSSPSSTYKGEPPVELTGATAEKAVDYTKKKNVFRLKLSNGGEYLFQAHDENELSQWISSINGASGAEEGAAGGDRSQTLPEGAKPPKEKKPFFTLKGSSGSGGAGGGGGGKQK